MTARYWEALEAQADYVNALRWGEVTQRLSPRVLENDIAYRLQVERSDTYFVSPNICDVLTAGMESVPDYALRRELIPSEHGFAWWAKPFMLGAGDNSWSGISWRTGVFRDAGDGSGSASGVDVTGIQNVTVARVQDMTAEARRELGVRVTWSIGQTWHEQRDALSTQVARSCLMALAGFFGFLRSPHVTTERYGPPRFLRRGRTLGEVGNHETQVIRLRIPKHKERGNEESSVIDWQFRWVVRGHWRDQWYPSIGAHAPVYIMEYLKGPEDKPIKEIRGRLFNVVQ